jgi:hypothetical protein
MCYDAPLGIWSGLLFTLSVACMLSLHPCMRPPWLQYQWYLEGSQNVRSTPLKCSLGFCVGYRSSPMEETSALVSLAHLVNSVAHLPVLENVIWFTT